MRNTQTQVTAEKAAGVDMNITRETKLKDLLTQYPWLKDEMSKVNDKFKMLGAPMGKLMLRKADLAEMSKKSGMNVDEIIGNITDEKTCEG